MLITLHDEESSRSLLLLGNRERVPSRGAAAAAGRESREMVCGCGCCLVWLERSCVGLAVSSREWFRLVVVGGGWGLGEGEDGVVALQGEGRLALRHGVRVTSESDLVCGWIWRRGVLRMMSRVCIRVLQCCNVCVISFLVFWVSYVSELH